MRRGPVDVGGFRFADLDRPTHPNVTTPPMSLAPIRQTSQWRRGDHGKPSVEVWLQLPLRLVRLVRLPTVRWTAKS